MLHKTVAIILDTEDDKSCVTLHIRNINTCQGFILKEFKSILGGIINLLSMARGNIIL